MFNSWLRKGSIILTAFILLFSLAACGTESEEQPANQGSNEGNELSGEINIDGSSTVFPVSQAVAEEFMAIHDDVMVTVNLSGSSNGFKALIAGEIQIADASRQIKDKEVDALKAEGQEAVEMPVAFDGITVVINPENDWATEMTVDELKKIWEVGSTVENWSDVNPEWPNEPIKLYGPGTASGTFEYFTGAINGTKNESREDYTPSEDDNVLVTGVSGDKYAMGYFGFSYYVENQDKLNAVSIKVDESAAAVAPTVETIKDGTYKPLSRPIYIYPVKSALEKKEIQEFLKYYMSEEGQALAEEVGYVALPAEMYAENLSLLP
ncbi:PstS family phosphate ABC transporter substrate-binding protein [Chengkuizengella axinellae]|uniref:Phosphate-binding protein n=1 Tax=Chengkuizengella axinellae TaxID=3064388 RepID=A0ABT9J088_9BACL|nr:PstS family phosphate ABC transporter substrate-binding protein [Chengkuizengella sp. 2205SS18-9]MDP5274439.1 PstS family phosphate ABC transporter substrate-binding protein [Chengkuizengella sp. 2205SS18-9]